MEQRTLNGNRYMYCCAVKTKLTLLTQLYPYHLSDVLVKGLRLTPFKYYLDMMADVMKSGASLKQFVSLHFLIVILFHLQKSRMTVCPISLPLTVIPPPFSSY